jgi:hypothetical protein
MSLLLLAIVGTIGPVVAMLHPIQSMKFYQQTAAATQKPSWEEGVMKIHYRASVKGSEPHLPAGYHLFNINALLQE